jgi:hypothetical protein
MSDQIRSRVGREGANVGESVLPSPAAHSPSSSRSPFLSPYIRDLRFSIWFGCMEMAFLGQEMQTLIVLPWDST